MADFEGDDLGGSRFERVDVPSWRPSSTGATPNGRRCGPPTAGFREAWGHRRAALGPRSFEVRKCLLVVLNEEWHHRLFAERDLDALEVSRGTPRG